MGLKDPVLSKSKKILQNLGKLAFFKSIIFCYLKKNNPNQEAFIDIIINYKLLVFLLACYAKYFFKDTNPKNQVFLFC